MLSRYDFSRIKTQHALLAVLGIEKWMLDSVLEFRPPIDPSPDDKSSQSIVELAIPAFLKHQVPKKRKGRGHRIVWEPTLCKSAYKGLARKLDVYFSHHLDGYPHYSVFGYRPGRNIRENAHVHVGAERILSVDIAGFFPSISQCRIENLFLDLGVSASVADLLSRFVTIDGKLPLGLPTSPVLSNAVALPIDIELSRLSGAINCKYSRYADDITFSGSDEVPDIDAVKACLEGNGFQIAGDKTRWSKRGQSHYVTGLSVSDPIRPHVPKDRKRSLRQQLYYMKKFGIDDHFRRIGINDSNVIQQAVNSIDGMVKFVAHHEPQMAAALRYRWGDILRSCNAKPTFKPKVQGRKPFFIYVDEAEFRRGDDKVLALAMSVSQHQNIVEQATRDILEAEIEDFWAPGNIETLIKKGLHFADSTEDLRDAYVKRLASLPFEGYVAFSCYNNQTYQNTYLRLLGSMLTRRLMAAESQLVCLFFEENSKVSQAAIRALVELAHKRLREAKNRHPIACSVEFVKKPNLGVSVPDFLLGVLGKYLQSQPGPAGRPESRDRLMFDRLRDKYRLILDLEDWTEFSRRKPIAPWH